MYDTDVRSYKNYQRSMAYMAIIWQPSTSFILRIYSTKVIFYMAVLRRVAACEKSLKRAKSMQVYRIVSTRFISTLPNLPSIQTCPEPYCQCLPTPEGLDIDRKTPLDGTVPSYDMHLIVQSAPVANWSSRFEDDDTLAARVKKAFSRGGRFHSVRYISPPIGGEA